MSDCCSCTLLIGSITLLVGLIFYLPIEFAIYYPYFDKDWESTTCMVSSIQRFHVYSWEDTDEDASYYLDYSLFDVKVSIDGEWKQGFACGCSDATMLSGTAALNGQYPYQYSLCRDDRECGNMYLMPAWYCNECKNCTKYISRGAQKCKYLLKNGNDVISHAKQIPSGYKLDYPTEHSTYIQVIFMDSPFYYKSDYIGFQVVVLGIMVLLPSLIVILVLLYYLIVGIKKCL
ncbi:unnamed protein product [Blepharisma stoltei]|uniref:Uncharacterized protein n=1 Tax=Blepharisma stoltei TaxID=1481888 RepID=A0AAU9KAH7_9CILI|nr:unnamed protein product [Blepharisma stoltei]